MNSAARKQICGFYGNQPQTFLVLFAAFHDEDMEIRQAAMLGFRALGLRPLVPSCFHRPSPRELGFQIYHSVVRQMLVKLQSPDDYTWRNANVFGKLANHGGPCERRR